MKHTKQLFLLGIIISFLATELHGQELSLISNVSFFSSDGKYHFALGEPVTQDFSSSNFNITSGFYQKNLFVTDITEIESAIDANVFPNPVSNELFIEVDNQQDLRAQIVDVQGSIVRTINNLQSEAIDFSTYESGMYSLFISNQSGKINTYKIIKIK